MAGPAAPTQRPETAPDDLSEASNAAQGRPRAAARKPAGFTFCGQSYAATTWPQFLVTLCQIMAERHPDDFVARALNVRGPRRRHIATAPDDMINLVPIGVAGLWLEGNQSASSAQRVAQLILKAFDYANDDLQVVMQPLAG